MKGVKQCSKCGKDIRGPRTRICPHCKFELIPNLKYGITNTATNKEINVLKKAIEDYNNGVDLSEVCIKINDEIEQIKVEIPLTKKSEIDWRTLEKGDLIKISPFGGSMWKNSDGQEISMGYSGIFKVLYLDNNGIHAIGTKNEGGGHCYIWMNEEKTTDIGITRRPHVILNVKKNVVKNDED